MKTTLSTTFVTVHYRLRAVKVDGVIVNGTQEATGEKYAQPWAHEPYSKKYNDETGRFKVELLFDDELDAVTTAVTKVA